MGYASLYAQTAKKQASTMAQDKTLGRGKGLGIDQKGNKNAIYQTLFEEARKQITLVYLPGTMAYVKLHYPELSDEVLVAEMRLDDLWLSMREGKDTLEQFKETLTTRKELHLQAVELYRKQRNGKEGEQGSFF